MEAIWLRKILKMDFRAAVACFALKTIIVFQHLLKGTCERDVMVTGLENDFEKII